MSGTMAVDRMTAPESELHPTKVRILDAAEELFAARGFHGVSIRDITLAAGVEVALANYHFGPKENLFKQVVMRRVQEHCDGQLGELDRVEAAANGVASVEQVVRAFCRFSFLKMMTGELGWKRYFQLVARTSLLPIYEPALAPLNKPYGLVVRRYTAAFQAALPAMRPSNLVTAFYLLQGMVARFLAQTELLERQSHGLCRAADFESHLARLVPFAAAGFYALAGQGELGSPSGTEPLPAPASARPAESDIAF
jgi:AcrR family transcriptional regulator